MNEIVNKEKLINTCSTFMNMHKNDEHTQNVILDIFSELLDYSQDTIVDKLTSPNNKTEPVVDNAPDVQNHVESQSESQILESCIELMQNLTDDFLEWYNFVHGEDAMQELSEEERFNISISYFKIVQKLFLQHTHHSGGTSTRQKCREIGVAYDEGISFSYAQLCR